MENWSCLETIIPTPDGTCVRDYIHVNDLADAHVLALKHLEAGNSSAALNLGHWSGMLRKGSDYCGGRGDGSKVPRRMGPRRPGDPPALVADPARAQALLQWKPKRSLKEIVETAVAVAEARGATDRKLRKA